MEYELVDTGVFDNDRYFDVEVEHAKAGPEDILCRVTVHNRSAPMPALHVLPTLWFRNTWSWEDGEPKPRLARVESAYPVVRAEHRNVGVFYLHAERRSSPAVLRERDEHGAGVRQPSRRRASPRTA